MKLRPQHAIDIIEGKVVDLHVSRQGWLFCTSEKETNK